MYLLKVIILILTLRLGLCSRYGGRGNAAIRTCVDLLDSVVATKTNRYGLCGSRLGEPSSGKGVALGRYGNRTVVRLMTWTSDAERCTETGRSLGSLVVNFQTAALMYNCAIQFNGDSGLLPSFSLTTEKIADGSTDNHSDPICSNGKPYPKGLPKCLQEISRACKRGKIQKYVRRIISQACYMHINRNRYTAVLYAARFKKREMFNLLVEGGADICSMTKSGKNLLQCAVIGGDEYIVKSVIERRLFDINVTTGAVPKNSIFQAALFGHYEVFLLLLQHGADYTGTYKMGTNLLHVASSRKGNVAMVKHILDMNIPGVTLETKDLLGDTPVMRAAGKCNMDIVNLLKKRGCNMKPAERSLRHCRQTGKKRRDFNKILLGP